MPESRRQPKLHLDADTSSKALHRALSARGYDMTRTPTAWLSVEADDEAQLLGATAHGRVLFTYDIRDCTELAQKYAEHAGIVVAAQRRWSFSSLIVALERLIVETTAHAWIGQMHWLNRWRI